MRSMSDIKQQALVFNCFTDKCPLTEMGIYSLHLRAEYNTSPPLPGQTASFGSVTSLSPQDTCCIIQIFLFLILV